MLIGERANIKEEVDLQKKKKEEERKGMTGRGCQFDIPTWTLQLGQVTSQEIIP